MSDGGFTRGPDDRGDDAVGRDLESLRNVSTRSQSDLETTLRAARSRAASSLPGGVAMAMQMLKRKPALATAVAVVAVALGLLAVPISYERTTGYEVTLTLDGANVAQDQVANIARSFKQVLDVEGVMVEASLEDGRMTFVMRAAATGAARVAAQAYAKELTALGYGASVAAVAKKAKVSSNVYAYAMDRVIEVQTDGRSAAELESEIRQRFAEAGITGAEVSVRDLGDNGREVRVKLERENVGPEDSHAMPELVLTKDGRAMSGGLAVRVMKKKDASGTITTTLKISSDTQNIDIEIPNAESMSDAAVAATIESKLREAGLDALVKVEGGHISVEKRRP